MRRRSGGPPSFDGATQFLGKRGETLVAGGLPVGGSVPLSLHPGRLTAQTALPTNLTKLTFPRRFMKHEKTDPCWSGRLVYLVNDEVALDRSRPTTVIDSAEVVAVMLRVCEHRFLPSFEPPAPAFVAR